MTDTGERGISKTDTVVAVIELGLDKWSGAFTVTITFLFLDLSFHLPRSLSRTKFLKMDLVFLSLQKQTPENTEIFPYAPVISKTQIAPTLSTSPTE